MAAVTVGVGVATALAGCGSGGSGSSGSGSSIVIGVEGPMTGIYAEIGAGLWNGARAAAAEIKALFASTCQRVGMRA